MAGDADARLGELIARYANLIRSAVARVVGRRDEDVADEVIQQVSEALWKQLRAEQTILHPASYIYRCAIRETVRLIRRELALGHVVLDDAADTATPGPDPEEAARASQVAQATDQALAAMLGERATAVRAHLAGFTVEDLMQMHGWPYQKARNLIARGLADLRERLRLRGLP